ncbi:MAG: 3-carboxymuconate cyclase [Sediminibacterium sp.]|nr:MAG: 3-carboxymuconate cyclase [Sediminibacterium sp.] [Sediminibacterium sp. FEMGT703S]
MKKIISISLLFISFGTFSLAQKSQSNFKILIGTYTNAGNSEGIYYYQFNKDGSAKSISQQKAEEPSFLITSTNQQFVYSVNELGKGNGAVSAYAFNKTTGEFKLLNSVLSGGDHPCHISTDRKNRFVFVSNYSGGNLSAIAINADGSLSNEKQTIQHTGSGANKARQEKAHVHSAVLSPDEKYLIVQDLGTDKISVYGVDLNNKYKPLSENPISVFNCNPGDGPRHISFHPSKPFVYAVQELTGSVTVLAFNNGELKKVQQINMFDQVTDKKSGAADIHLSPDGKFLYASNRADYNDLAIYIIASNGLLTWVGSQPTLGLAPRNFAIDPTGNFLLAANQNSNEIVVFKRNKTTGLLKDTGKRIAVGRPVCIQFVQ